MQGTDVTLSSCSLTNSDNSLDGIIKVRVLFSFRGKGATLSLTYFTSNLLYGIIKLNYMAATNKQLTEYCIKMKNNPTKHEMDFMLRLHKYKIPYKFQVIVGFYIADFILNDVVIVEIDGKSHDNTKKYDNARDKYLRGKGYKVIRIKNEDVYKYDMKALKKKAIFNQANCSKKQWKLKVGK